MINEHKKSLINELTSFSLYSMFTHLIPKAYKIKPDLRTNTTSHSWIEVVSYQEDGSQKTTEVSAASELHSPQSSKRHRKAN